jgi:hypothetical protein
MSSASASGKLAKVLASGAFIAGKNLFRERLLISGCIFRRCHFVVNPLFPKEIVNNLVWGQRSNSTEKGLEGDKERTKKNQV